MSSRLHDVVSNRCLLAVWVLFFSVPTCGKVLAAVTTVGAVLPVPPAGGGPVAGAFTLGDGSFGSVTINGGTGITLNGGATIGNGVGGIGVLSLTGFASDVTFSAAGLDMVIGDEGAASVTLSSSARIVVSDDTTIATQTTGLGNLSVSGLGTVYTSGDDMTVGLRGRAIVDVLSGGLVTSDVVIVGDLSTANGAVTVSGELSRWTASLFTVADAGVGSVTVSGGALLNTSTLSTAVLSGSTATIDVTGVASRWEVSGASTVGGAGTAVWNVTGGGRMTFDNSLLLAADVAARTDLTISGQNSRVSTVAGLSIGSGEATITIADGGVLAIGSASTLPAKGRVALAGGRWQMPSASIVGLVEGSGTLQIPTLTISSTSPRGRLQTRTGDILLATGNIINSGFIDQDGGELEVRGTLANNFNIHLRNGATLRVGGTGLDNNSGSQIAITSGVVDLFGAVDNNTGAEIAVVGGSTAVFHDAVTNSGTIFVSASSEIVFLENLAFAPVSALQVELSSLADVNEPTDALGLVDITGGGGLDGQLEITLASGFNASLGDTFQILRASGGIGGIFDTETLPALGGGLAFDVQYTNDSVVLAVINADLPGDFDLDGDVDGADFLLWQRDPGVGNLADWQANFGTPLVASSRAGSSPASAVPEPDPRRMGTLSAVFLWFLWRKRTSWFAPAVKRPIIQAAAAKPA